MQPVDSVQGQQAVFSIPGTGHFFLLPLLSNAHFPTRNKYEKLGRVPDSREREPGRSALFIQK